MFTPRVVLRRKIHSGLFTEQRRIRHLRSVAVRNISLSALSSSYKKGEESYKAADVADEELLSVFKEGAELYFSLHSTCPSLTDTAFYVSEICRNSLNPVWAGIDMLQINWDYVNHCDSTLIVRIWVAENSGSGHLKGKRRQWVGETGAYNENVEGFRLIIEWNIDFYGLHFCGESLHDLNLNFPKNSVILEFCDGFYCAENPLLISHTSELSEEEKKSVEGIGNSHSNKSTESLVLKGMRFPKFKIVEMCSLNYIERLRNAQNAIRETCFSTKAAHNALESLLKKKTDTGLVYLKDDLKARISGYKKQLDNLKKTYNVELAGYSSRKKILDRKRELLRSYSESQKDGYSEGAVKSATLRRTSNDMDLLFANDLEFQSMARAIGENGQKKKEVLLALLKSSASNEELCHKIEGVLSFRRAQIISQLHSIYWIEPISVSSYSFSIRNLPLPRTNFSECKDEDVSSALGYVCHFIFLIAKYRGVPLRYPVRAMGSRSVIYDFISTHHNPGFPLFIKGVERARFEYGLFLLNKDIEQLMNFCGMNVSDLRNTLMNAKALVSG
eukprot:Nk52_evm2s442 gene=Nk52_evmTU2s442